MDLEAHLREAGSALGRRGKLTPPPQLELRAATWNVGSKSDARVLRALRRLSRAHDVIGLQETADREKVLREFAGESGWTLVYHAGSGRGRTCLLVAPGHEIEYGWHELSPRTHVGPWGAGPEVVGRKWICWAGVDGVPIGVVHFVASVQRPAATKKQRQQRRERRRLWADQAGAVVSWAGGRDVLVLGDLNATPRYPGLEILRRGGFDLHTRRSHKTRAIDYLAARGLDVTNLGALDGYPSDHRPVTGTARPKE